MSISQKDIILVHRCKAPTYYEYFLAVKKGASHIEYDDQHSLKGTRVTRIKDIWEARLLAAQHFIESYITMREVWELDSYASGVEKLERQIEKILKKTILFETKKKKQRNRKIFLDNK